MPGTGIGLEDFNDPSITPSSIARWKSSPELIALMTRHGSGQVDLGNMRVIVQNGRITETNTGSAWKPIVLGSAIAATGGMAGAFVGPAVASAGSTLGPSTAASMAATTAASSSVPANLAAVGGGHTLAGLSYGSLLKYGLPIAGDLIGGVVKSKADRSAFDAQQKYLEEALAYQKEQDAYARTTDASRYADRQGLDAAALQYGKDSDEYARAVAAAAVKKEQTRYGDYQGRIAPFVANGVNSNDRMASLLGLPARAASAWGDGTRGAPGGPDAPGPAPMFRGSSGNDGYGVADPATFAFVQQWQQTHSPSEGIDSLHQALAKNGFQVTRPTHAGGRLQSDDKLIVNGQMVDFIRDVGGPNQGWQYNPVGPGRAVPMPASGSMATPGVGPSTYASRTTTAPAAAPVFNPGGYTPSTARNSFPKGTPAPIQTTQPLTRDSAAPATTTVPQASTPSAVQLRAPDGSVKAVRADQVQHFIGLGASMLQGAA